MSLRVPETQYENMNLQKEQKGRAELNIPRYHELVPKQEEKKVRVSLCSCGAGFGAMMCRGDKSLEWGQCRSLAPCVFVG